LECISRFYQNKQSPLYDALKRYKDFFKLFVDFRGYIDFFLLQDFVDTKEQVKFFLPFDNFIRHPLPQTDAEYKRYRVHTINLINNRNKKIKKFDKSNSRTGEKATLKGARRTYQQKEGRKNENIAQQSSHCLSSSNKG
jgi:hypothetical protein